MRRGVRKRGTAGRTRASVDLWRRKLRCQCGHAFAKTKWHTKTDFITYTYKCYDQTRTGTIAARLKNGLSIEGVCRSPLVQDWKMYTFIYPWPQGR